MEVLIPQIFSDTRFKMLTQSSVQAKNSNSLQVHITDFSAMFQSKELNTYYLKFFFCFLDHNIIKYDDHCVYMKSDGTLDYRF